MRKTAESDLSEYENFISVCGNDKDTGLPDKSVDFITTAQAFHWFDRQLFKLECQRILKDNGKVILVWNSRDDESEIINEGEKIIAKYCDADSIKTQGESPEKYNDFFSGGVCEYKVFRNDLYLDLESYIGGSLSSSYSPKEENEPEKYHGFVNDLTGLFNKYSIDGIMKFPQITKTYTGNI